MYVGETGINIPKLIILMVKACFALKGVQSSEGVAVCAQLSHPLVL